MKNTMKKVGIVALYDVICLITGYGVGILINNWKVLNW